MTDDLNSDVTFMPLQFSRNTLECVLDPVDTSLADRSGLRYYLEIWVPEFPGSTSFKRLIRMPGSEKPPTVQGGATVYEGAYFRIDELLDGLLQRQKPQHSSSNMCVVASLTTPYFVKESAEKDGILFAETAITRPTKWALKAGLSEADFADWGEGFFTSYMQTERPFLTWQPKTKLISPDAEEYLYFLLNCWPLPTMMRRRVEISYSDGFVETIEAGTITGFEANQVLCVPVGYRALGLNSREGVVSYKVWISDEENQRISEVRTYRLDPYYQPQERYILFANSLGGWDTLRLTGEGSESLKTQRATAELERPAGAGADFSELQVVYIQGERELTVSTGYLRKAAQQQLRYFDELLLSPEIYLITDRGHYPLELITSALTDYEDNADLLARSFSFRMTTPVVNFSSLPQAPEEAVRLVGWRGIGIVQVLDSFGKRTAFGRPLKLQKYYPDDGTTYKPITEKPNQPGDPDYIDKLPLPFITAGSTPYPSTAISRNGTFVRNNCAASQVGEAALIEIAGGRYGSEISQADADAKAEAEWKALDTQAYANTYGACNLAPWLYTVTLPDGQWHYRSKTPALTYVYWWDGGDGSNNVGNTWDLASTGRPFCYNPGTNALNFPVKSSNWRLGSLPLTGTTYTLKIYRNGVLAHTETGPLGDGNFLHMGLPINPSNGDRIYIDLTSA